MRNLFERLRDDGEVAFEALIQERIEEDLQLDFKVKSSPDRPNLGDDDKRYLGEALSGFSNSAGGTLVFGVDCRVGADGVDCVQALQPFVAYDKIASDVRSMLGSLLQPGNDGIEVAAIASESFPGRGFVIVWIPRSERRPHQSRAKGHFKYFKRIGRDFHAMEHYDIDDAFSRTGVVALELKDNIRLFSSTANELQFILEMFMHNYSDTIAKYPYIVVERLSGCILPQTVPGQPLKIEQGIKKIALFGGSNDVIHPGTERNVANLLVTFRIDSNSRWTNVYNQETDIVSLECLFGCENGRSLRHHLSLSPIAFGAPPS
jgi:hypothetical protein